MYVSGCCFCVVGRLGGCGVGCSGLGFGYCVWLLLCLYWVVCLGVWWWFRLCLVLLFVMLCLGSVCGRWCCWFRLVWLLVGW